MNKTAVIYKSNYGSTTQYAEAIAKALNCDLIPRTAADTADLTQYDTIIYGGGLYAGGIIGVDIIVKSFDALKGKNLIVFTVGASDPTDTSKYTAIINKAFTPEMKEKIKFFHLRGNLDHPRLNPLHRSMMWMMKKHIEKKNPQELNEEEQNILDTYGQKVTFVDLSTIRPILDYVATCKV